MKLTKSQLKQIIKEELHKILREVSPGGPTAAHLQGPKILGALSGEAQEDYKTSPSILADKEAECKKENQCLDEKTGECIECPEGAMP
jgi:hypothetical protein